MNEAPIVARRTVRVNNAKGVHARPSAQIVKAAQSYDADIVIRHGDQTASAASILDVMMLAACAGCDVEITAEGPDADAAIETIAALFGDRFGEET